MIQPAWNGHCNVILLLVSGEKDSALILVNLMVPIKSLPIRIGTAGPKSTEILSPEHFRAAVVVYFTTYQSSPASKWGWV